MKAKHTAGIVAGLVGLIAPLFLELPGLNFAGQVTLGIFLMAGCFWVMEPVPIYTTSLLVIFLEVLLLSAEGPLVTAARLPSAPARKVAVADGTPAWEVPTKALKNDRGVLLERPGQAPQSIEAKIVQRNGETVWIQAAGLGESSRVISDPTHWLTTYKPTPYRTFFASLADPVIILFMGGCLLADASVKYRLDRALTSLFLAPMGSAPSMITLGLLLVSATLSAFMSNTATTAMMMTLVMPILAKLPERDPLRIAVVLAIPVGANIGGIATPIGTPPNAIALAALTKQGAHLPFATWVILALPIVLITLLLAWLVLIWLYPSTSREIQLGFQDRFERTPKAMGMYVVFGLTALLWLTEQQHGISSNIVAFLPIVALPIFGIIGKKEIHNLPWDVLWLMAGGISLGTALRDTGLAEWAVRQVEWSSMGGYAIVAGLALFSFALANFLSHTVTVTLLAPIAVTVGATSTEISGFSLANAMVAVAVASSYGMSLPISTPPNAIAMGTGVLETRHLIRAGGTIGLIGIALTLFMARFYWPLFLK